MCNCKYCSYHILQELILKGFSKVELAKVIKSHSKHITEALKAQPQEIQKFFSAAQLAQMKRFYIRFQQSDSCLPERFFNE